MTDQQPILSPPVRHEQPTPIPRRSWDGNGWTSAAATAAAAGPIEASIEPAFGRSAS